MNKRRLLSGTLVCLLFAGTGTVGQRGGARRPTRGAVCGDPTAACKTSYEFRAYDLPFRIPASAVIWESEPFYAVILKSMKTAADDCRQFVSEDERLAAQALFPHNKVFADRACGETGEPYYVDMRPGTRILAAYAGRTRAEAAKFLAQVKATGKFPGAYLRRTSIGFNGT